MNRSIMQLRQSQSSQPSVGRVLRRVEEVDVEQVITSSEIIHEAQDVIDRIHKKSHRDPVHLLIDRFCDRSIRDAICFRLLRRTDLAEELRSMIQWMAINACIEPTELTGELRDLRDQFAYTVGQIQHKAVEYLVPRLPAEGKMLKHYLEGDRQVVKDLPMSEPIYQDGHVYVQKCYRRSHTSVFLPPYIDAVKHIRTIPPDERILEIKSCDASTGVTLERWEALVTIRDVLSKKRYWITAYLSGLDMLRAFRDAMSGADHLADHGLVLQDINLNNIGIALRDGRGVLFDLEGLAIAGTVINGRLADKRYFPPEVRKTGEKKRFTCPIAPTEMMYQFGTSLQIFSRHPDIGLSVMVVTVLEALAERMIVPEPTDRPSFSEIIHRLDELIMTIN